MQWQTIIGRLFKLARMQFILAGLALFVFGALVAVLFGAPFSLGRLVLGCLIVLPAQLSVNFSNDYFDVDSDQLSSPSFISGGSSILLQHPELRGAAKWIATSLMLLSLSMGLLFVQVHALPVRWIGFVVLGNLLGWMYSAPPFRLTSRGLGEVSFTFVSGFLLPAMGYFIMRGALDADGAFLLPPLVCYGLVFILSVEIPDMEVDRQGEKWTWVARWGRRFGFTTIGCLLLAASLYFFILSLYPPERMAMDLRVAGVLSLLPLLPGLWGFLRGPGSKQPATRIATAIVIALALFAVLLDVYLFFLISR